jgi:hypothetical protein
MGATVCALDAVHAKNTSAIKVRIGNCKINQWRCVIVRHRSIPELSRLENCRITAKLENEGKRFLTVGRSISSSQLP